MYFIYRKVGIGWIGDPKPEIIAALEDGEYLVHITPLRPKADIAEYRKVYFAKLSYLAKEVGETKLSMHELVKEHALDVSTTTEFTLGRWLMALEQLDLWAFQTYEIILP